MWHTHFAAVLLFALVGFSAKETQSTSEHQQLLVEDLFLQLGSRDFTVREKALGLLQNGMNFANYTRLQEAWKASGDHEAIARAKMLIDEYYEKELCRYRGQFKFDFKGYPEYPWLTELTGSYQDEGELVIPDMGEIIQHYLKVAHDNGFKEGTYPEFKDFREATRLFFIDRFEIYFKEAFFQSQSRLQLNSVLKIKCIMMQRHFEMLVDVEKLYWKGRGEMNPLFEKK
jgi:hypothetical protein